MPRWQKERTLPGPRYLPSRKGQMTKAAAMRLNVGIWATMVLAGRVFIGKLLSWDGGLTARDMSLQMLLAREGLATVRAVDLGHGEIDYLLYCVGELCADMLWIDIRACLRRSAQGC